MVDENQVITLQRSDEFCGQFITAFRTLRYLMIYMGIWPERKYEKLYNLFWYFHLASLSFLIYGLVCGLADVSHDMDKSISNLGMTSAVICVICKWLTFSWNRVLIRKLMHFMNEDWINLENNTLIYKSVRNPRRLMMKYYRALNIFICTILFMALIAVMNLVADSVVAMNHHGNVTDQSYTLLVPSSWYRHNHNRSYTNQILITAQMTSMVSGLLGNTLVDGFFFITVLHTTGQFEILSDFIGRTKYDSLDPEHDKTKVKEMIRRHQMLLNVTADIQECYGMITFQQLAISTLYLCFFEYAFIMELQKGGEGRMVALKYALTSLTGLENIFVYCFLGDNLTDQGLALRMAVYNSEWYNTTPSVNLSLSIVMTKALQPIVLSAAKIFPLTLQNFTVIIKSSVSYLSVLRALSVSEV